MQASLSEPEPATVISENPLTIRYQKGQLPFLAHRLDSYLPRTGDRVLAAYHLERGDHIILERIVDESDTDTINPPPDRTPSPDDPEPRPRARLIKETHRHHCHEELDTLGDPYIGSIAECSCGKRYLRAESQLDGRYWSPHNHEIYHTPERRP